MNDIKKDLDMVTPQNNTKNLSCLGCRVISDELYPLNVDGRIILMCSTCKESLSAMFEKEDFLDTVSFVQQQFNDGITVNKTGEFSASAEFGIFNKIQYMQDHVDC